MKPDESTLPDHAWDVPVYRTMLDACFQVLASVIPGLPDEAEPHLIRGLTRSCQRVPDLIALGIATWRSPQRFPYLDVAGRECQDMLQRLRYCQQHHGDHVDLPMCHQLVDQYTEAIKQLRALAARLHARHTTASRHRTPAPMPPPRHPEARMTLGMA
jgi:hypothetical protein